jgi:hypothetical protein
MTSPPLVEVTWEDACCLDPNQRWVDHDKHTYVPLIVKSVGYLLYDGKEGVIIAAAWSPDCTGPRDQIPRGMVRQVRKLKA